MRFAERRRGGAGHGVDQFEYADVREDRSRQGLPLVRAYTDSHAAAPQELQSLRDPVERDGARVRVSVVDIQEACGHRWKVETGSALAIEIMHQTSDQIDRVHAHPPADLPSPIGPIDKYERRE